MVRQEIRPYLWIISHVCTFSLAIIRLHLVEYFSLPNHCGLFKMGGLPVKWEEVGFSSWSMQQVSVSLYFGLGSSGNFSQRKKRREKNRID